MFFYEFRPVLLFLILKTSRDHGLSRCQTEWQFLLATEDKDLKTKILCNQTIDRTMKLLCSCLRTCCWPGQWKEFKDRIITDSSAAFLVFVWDHRKGYWWFQKWHRRRMELQKISLLLSWTISNVIKQLELLTSSSEKGSRRNQCKPLRNVALKITHNLMKLYHHNISF